MLCLKRARPSRNEDKASDTAGGGGRVAPAPRRRPEEAPAAGTGGGEGGTTGLMRPCAGVLPVGPPAPVRLGMVAPSPLPAGGDAPPTLEPSAGPRLEERARSSRIARQGPSSTGGRTGIGVEGTSANKSARTPADAIGRSSKDSTDSIAASSPWGCSDSTLSEAQSPRDDGGGCPLRGMSSRTSSCGSASNTCCLVRFSVFHTGFMLRFNSLKLETASRTRISSKSSTRLPSRSRTCSVSCVQSGDRSRTSLNAKYSSSKTGIFVMPPRS
mmetsp:Transcript_105491/g.303358  ORF Transcript_105491/g.303358 Transcript_105491/m.303358 type:complete len:271 (-) Transcript_105491:370-1182(-)